MPTTVRRKRITDQCNKRQFIFSSKEFPRFPQLGPKKSTNCNRNEVNKLWQAGKTHFYSLKTNCSSRSCKNKELLSLGAWNGSRASSRSGVIVTSFELTTGLERLSKCFKRNWLSNGLCWGSPTHCPLVASVLTCADEQSLPSTELTGLW